LGGHITRTGGDHIACLEQAREPVDSSPATDRGLFLTHALCFSQDVLGFLPSPTHRFGGQPRELTAKPGAVFSRRALA
jgi:hypothetical protein